MSDPTTISISQDDPVFNAADTDPAVSPADDFYRFVNGGWLDANPVPDEYPAWGAIQELNSRTEDVLHEILTTASNEQHPETLAERLVGAHFAAGMDTDRIEHLGIAPIAPMLERIDSVSDKASLATVVADLHRDGIGAFFGVAVSPDFEDSSVNLLWIGQGGLGLPDRDYYLRDDDTSKGLLAAYREHVNTMFSLLGRADHESAADKVVAVETMIAEVSYTNVQMRDVELITNKVTREDVEAMMPTFGLGRYLDAVGAKSHATFSMDNLGFYPAIDALIAEAPLGDIITYLTWHVIQATASALPEAFEKESFNFYGTTLGGQQAQKERWKRVLTASTGDIGQLISQLYVAENFPPKAKTRMEHLVSNLLDAMRASIESIEWMSDATKPEALTKLEGFGYKIGYPDEWRDYTGLELTTDAWLSNRLAASRFEFNRRMATVGEPVNPHEWELAPHVVNAYYHPLHNEIVFPAGILQPPFFSLEADDPTNYGAIGAIIGHEITHGFDDQGSRFDAAGNVRDWWTEHDRAEFDQRAKVVVDQYSAYEVEDGLHVNGELTLGENIADIGGLKIAFTALQTALDGADDLVGGLTPAQRFYIAWATGWRQNYTDAYLRLLVNSDPHSPAYIRGSVPLSNLATFREAFDIPDGAPAIRPPSERVDIW
ncbi:MAG: M13 family metallopeptidase [Actinomycetota bacterium]